MKVSFLTIGSEILDGRVVDTNSSFMAQVLQAHGFSVREVLTCDDVLDDMLGAFRYLLGRSEVVITTGGLGPTSDDLTREAVAALFDRPLEANPEVLSALEENFRRRGRKFDPSNAKQASFPAGAEVVPNPLGTAAGFAVRDGGKLVVCLPGVPREMKVMFPESVVPLLCAAHPDRPPVYRAELRVFGHPEAVVGTRVDRCELPEGTKVSYRASFPEVHVILSSPSPLDESIMKVTESIGEDFIVAHDLSKGLPEVVYNLLAERGLTLSTAETVSGGVLADLCNGSPEAARRYLGGIVAGPDGVLGGKLPGLAGWDEPYSDEGARLLARSVREQLGASVGLVVHGEPADPDGCGPGTYFIGLAADTLAVSYKFMFAAPYPMFRRYAAAKALDVLRRHLSGFSSPKDAVRD